MHMQITPTQAALHNAAIERRQRMEEAARRFREKANPIRLPAPARMTRPHFVSVQASQHWNPTHHDRHMYDYYRNLARQDARLHNGACIADLLDAIDLVCPFGIVDVKSARRQRDLVRWRQALMEACKRYTTRSLPEIGRMLGGKDHTTVLHGVRVVTEAYEAGQCDEVESLGFVFRIRR